MDKAIRPRQYTGIIFLILIILHLAPLWAFKYFPSQDGPSHLANAYTLMHYNDPARGIFRAYYTVNRNFYPNWLTYYILVALMYFLPPLIAEKALLSIYAVLFPLSARYIVRAVNSDSEFLAFFSFPFIYSYLLHMGFYNFCFGLAFSFFAFGYWFKNRNQLKPKQIITLGILALITYLCHPVPVMALCALIFTITLLLARKHLFLLSLAFVPLVIAFFIFLFRHAYAFNLPVIIYYPPQEALQGLFSFDALVSYSRAETLPARILAGLIFAILIYLIFKKKKNAVTRDRKALAYAFIAGLIMYLFIPDSMPPWGFLTVRIGIYVFFTLIFYCATYSYNATFRRIISLFIIAVTLLFLVARSTRYAELNGYLEEFTSIAGSISSGKTLLQLDLSAGIPKNKAFPVNNYANPFIHASGYLVIEKDMVSLSNYGAACDYFPLSYRQELDPFEYLAPKDFWGIVNWWRADFPDYHRRAGGSVDYVLIYGIAQGGQSPKYAESVFKQLKEGYELVNRPAGRGLPRLYARKERAFLLDNLKNKP